MQLVNDRVWNPDSKLCNLSSSSPVYSIKHLETHCGAVFGKITCVRLLSIDKKTHYNQELFSAWKLSSPLPPTGINNVVITLSNWRKQDPDCGYRGLCVCVCVCVCVWLSCIQLFVTPWTVPTRLLHPWKFSRQEYWSGCHFLLQGIFPTQGSILCLLN